MFFNTYANSSNMIAEQHKLMELQNERIKEAELIRYNTAIRLEELYRGQTYATILYPNLFSLRNTTDKKELRELRKIILNILMDVLPEGIKLLKNDKVVLEIHRCNLISLSIKFEYKHETYKISIPDVKSIYRSYFMDEKAWIEKLTPSVWRVCDGSDYLIASSMFPNTLKDAFIKATDKSIKTEKTLL